MSDVAAHLEEIEQAIWGVKAVLSWMLFVQVLRWFFGGDS